MSRAWHPKLPQCAPPSRTRAFRHKRRSDAPAAPKLQLHFRHRRLAVDAGTSEIRPAIERYDVELRDLNPRLPLPGPLTGTRNSKILLRSTEFPEKTNFDALSQPGKSIYLLLRARLLREQRQLAGDAVRTPKSALIPFQQTVIDFEEARRRMETIEPQKCAAALAKMTADIAAAQFRRFLKAAPAILNRAATRLSQLRATLRTCSTSMTCTTPSSPGGSMASTRRPTGARRSRAASTPRPASRSLLPRGNRRTWRRTRGGSRRRRRRCRAVAPRVPRQRSQSGNGSRALDPPVTRRCSMPCRPP